MIESLCVVSFSHFKSEASWVPRETGCAWIGTLYQIANFVCISQTLFTNLYTTIFNKSSNKSFPLFIKKEKELGIILGYIYFFEGSDECMGHGNNNFLPTREPTKTESPSDQMSALRTGIDLSHLKWCATYSDNWWNVKFESWPPTPPSLKGYGGGLSLLIDTETNDLFVIFYLSTFVTSYW